MKTPVILLSPYAGDLDTHLEYLRRAIRDSVLKHNEAPYASHRMMPGALNDEDPMERAIGMECEEPWLARAERIVAYVDYGISTGMGYTLDNLRRTILIQYRRIGKNET